MGERESEMEEDMGLKEMDRERGRWVGKRGGDGRESQKWRKIWV